ncbi:MAG: SusC/RagA family TonB-linked outer membrane protein [Sphingobacteriia bacterium]|nr:SusC/RagA family TonB-linked outer membrane protein [Sphingobacteriia bacterium]
MLVKCFLDQPFTYEITDKIIVIKERPQPKPESKNAEAPPLTLLPPSTDVTIVVTDADGFPLEGAFVRVKGNTKGFSTDKNGQATLKSVDENEIVVISFTGYQSQEFKINKRSSIAIKLQASTSELDETVVIAYGKTTKRLATESVSKVKSEDIERQPVGNILSALESNVPGMQITQASGIPGRGMTILLRGQNSISNGRNPLYLVDGVPINPSPLDNSSSAGVTSNPLNSLNPQDIESVEVLKDASATAIYGSRGSNGVVLITTKKGKMGKVHLNAGVTSGASKATRLLHFLNKDQYLSLRREAFSNDGVTTLPANAYDLNGKWDTTRYTDWQKVFIGNTSNYINAQASLSGGTENTTFLFGANYYRESTIYIGDFYDKRYGFHLNVDHSSKDRKLRISFAALYSFDYSFLPQNDLVKYINLSPVAPALFDSAGKLNWQSSTWQNPYSNVYNISKGKTDYLSSNFTISYELFKGLEIKSNFGYSFQYLDQSQLNPIIGINPSTTTLSSATFGNSKRKSWVVEPQLSYSTILGRGRLTALLGSNLISQNQTYTAIKGTGFPNDGLIENIQAASAISISSNTYSLYKYIGAFARLNYVWDSKYLINLTADRDGSTRFGPNKRFANFGAAGFGWVFSNENFFKPLFKQLSFGKLRVSYGTTGNDQIPDYQFLDTYTTNAYPYQSYSTIFPQRLLNPDYTWEKNNKFELGIDLGFFKDRLLLTADYYNNQSSNQLLNYPLPVIAGFNSIIENLPAKIQNTGLEFQVKSVNIRQKNFQWQSSFNISIPRTKLLAFPGLATSSLASTYIIGQSTFIATQLLHYTGVDPQTGLYTYQDYDKDGKITFPNDYKTVVNTSQQYYGAFQNDFQYKGWLLSLSFQFVRQKNGKNYYTYGYGLPITASNQLDYIMDRWTVPGQSATVQKVSNSNTLASTAYSNIIGSDQAYSDASFIRLRNVNLSYQLSSATSKKMGLQSLKVYLQAQNLFTITSYKGLDPETKGSTPVVSVLAGGIQVSL